MAVKYAGEEYLVSQQRLSGDALTCVSLLNRVPFTDKTPRFRLCVFHLSYQRIVFFFLFLYPLHLQKGE